MKFSDAIAEEARRFKQGTGQDPTEEFLAVVRPCINLALTDVGDSWRWKQLEKTGSIVAIPTVTGTANIISASNSVTLASLTGSDDYIGRFFSKISGSNVYRILSRAGNVLILDQPIIEDTEIGAQVQIEKRFYTMPTECREILGWDAGVDRVFGLNQRGLRNTVPNYGAPLNDVPFDVAGTDEFTEDYSVGLVSIVGGTNILTNNGASKWLAAADPGNVINFSDVDYRIKRVESDTQLRLYNIVEGDVANVPYTISVDNAMTVRPYAAFTAMRLIQFQYMRHHYGLIHDDERIVLTEKAILAVLDFAQAYIHEAIGKDGWQSLLLKAQARLTSAQATSSPVRSAFKTFPPLIPRGMGRG